MTNPCATISSNSNSYGYRNNYSSIEKKEPCGNVTRATQTGGRIVDNGKCAAKLLNEAEPG